MGFRDAYRDTAVGESAASVVALVRDRQLSVAAAGVAYYAFNALLPTLVLGVLAVTASGYVGAAAERVAAFANVSPGNVRMFARTVRDGEGFVQLVAVAGLVAAWNALQLGRAIADVFEAVYGHVTRSRLERATDLVLVFLTWVGALLLLLVVGVALAYVESTVVFRRAWPAALFAGLLLVFLPMYVVFPPSASLREALPGTAFAAAVWTLSAVLFRWYASASTSVRFLGIVGVVLLVLTWLYVGSLALVAGVATNAVLADTAAEEGRETPHDED